MGLAASAESSFGDGQDVVYRLTDSQAGQADAEIVVGAGIGHQRPRLCGR